MNRDKLNKTNKLSFGGILFSAVILLIVTIFIAFSIGGVFAKYVTSDSSSNSASVANVGVEIFNLVEHGQAVAGVDYSKVIPGVDIPGPHIQLKINSEVSYTLYIEVTVRNCPTIINDEGDEVKAVYFDIADNWELVKTVEAANYTTSTYKYVVDQTNNVKNYVFKAGTEHVYLDANEITILQDDVIYVSEKYSAPSSESEDLSFSIAFKSYVQQVL